MLFKTKNSLIAFAFAIVVCVKCPAVMNVRQLSGFMIGYLDGKSLKNYPAATCRIVRH